MSAKEHNEASVPRPQACPPNCGGGDSLEDVLEGYVREITAKDLRLSPEDVAEIEQRMEERER